ncbi:MAG TPA: sigma-70 family RNA polymerase sigma factor, partial [Thermoanaerobaculia bacterium]|nr:sigma-70 family RNA polymerase sigma factor [Thermoanaerobaculia bacterium]
TRRVLAELPSERDRRILFRFYIDEDDKEQICRELSLTSLHFNRVLFRARERYRALYREIAERRAR